MRLLHIQDEIQSLAPYVSKSTRAEFLNDYLLIRATERAVLIVSEAARALPDTLIAQQPDIDWSAIRAIGNSLRHDYDHVEPLILWAIVDYEFPKLKKAIDQLLILTDG